MKLKCSSWRFLDMRRHVIYAKPSLSPFAFFLSLPPLSTTYYVHPQISWLLLDLFSSDVLILRSSGKIVLCSIQTGFFTQFSTGEAALYSVCLPILGDIRSSGKRFHQYYDLEDYLFDIN